MTGLEGGLDAKGEQAKDQRSQCAYKAGHKRH
jgi:hypothetical protein